MAKKDLQGRKIREITEMSRYWDAEDMMRNFDEEMVKLERGLGHMIWDLEENMVTSWIGPLPLAPKFEVSENEKEFKLRAVLPNVAKEKIRLNVGRNSVELSACSDDAICRPHYLAVDSSDVLDPDSARAKLTGDVFEVKISKAKKTRLKTK